jgi:integrase
MPASKITEKALQGLKTAAAQAKKPTYLWDTDTKGFGVRASPSGSLSFVFQTWEGGRGGKSRRITLSEVTLDKAREEAQGKRVEANKGELTSPRQERLRLQRQKQQQKTMAEVLSLYLEENRDTGRYWSELEDRFNKHLLPYLKGSTRRMTEITLEDLRELLRSYNDRPGAKRGVYCALSPLFKWALAEGYIASNPLASVPIPKGVNSRDRTLTEEEIRVFWEAASKLGYPWEPFYKLLLLTAQRREEVSAIEWAELDLVQGVWSIPGSKTKNKKAHIVQLSLQAIEVIRTIKKVKGVTFLFSTTGKTHVSGYARAKERIDKLLPSDFPPWRIHDLRRTAKTGFASLGVPKEVSEKILNHVSNSSSDLEAIYNRYEYLSERKKALNKWGEYISQLVLTPETKSEYKPAQ